ncbi:hypothetical protein CKO39_08600 [Rhodopseudomonas palustris]|nr:hypothetical protein CKO39_08600 [Rhodopseudomonas palustris]
MSRSDPLMSRGTARAFTSPRVRGEVAHRTQFDERVRARLHVAELQRLVTAARLGHAETPPHPTLLPARGEKELAAARRRCPSFKQRAAA